MLTVGQSGHRYTDSLYYSCNFFIRLRLHPNSKKCFLLKRKESQCLSSPAGLPAKGCSSQVCAGSPPVGGSPPDRFSLGLVLHTNQQREAKRGFFFFLTFSTFLIVKAVYAYYRKFRKKKTNKEEKKKIHINPTKLEEPSLPFLAYFLSAFISKF